jgi:aspartate aminotransferase
MSGSRFAGVEACPPDAVFHIKAQYVADPSEDKIDVAIGAYRTAEGKPFVLESVRRAELAVVQGG